MKKSVFRKKKARIIWWLQIKVLPLQMKTDCLYKKILVFLVVNLVLVSM